ncbi:MAG: CDP-alcohol phosphatidyltransferase family protein [Candidatus Ornithospirochaeta sp.]
MANLLSASRIAAAVFLLFFPPLSREFFALYLYCGISDIMDGFIARRTGTESKFGSSLDTAGDIVFASVALLKICPVLALDKWILWVTIAIATIKVATIICGYWKSREFVAVHSALNKGVGFLLFVYPLLTSFSFSKYLLVVLVSMALAAALDEGKKVWRYKALRES